MDKCDNNVPTIITDNVDRIIAIGDIHGDLKLAVDCLKLAEVIPKDFSYSKNDKTLSPKWIGGKTVIVQVGDQIDRCRPFMNKCDHPDSTIDDEASDIKILNLFTYLHHQAKKVGGAVYSLLGNHEVLNSLGNLNYVSYLGLKQFEGYADPEDPTRVFTSGYEARKYAFSPGREYANYLACNRVSILKIGNILFMHGGLTSSSAKNLDIKSNDDLKRINNDVQKWLQGKMEKNNYLYKILRSYDDSLFWNRKLGTIPPNQTIDHPDCAEHVKPMLNLKLLKIDHMIIGHTPQINKEIGINSTCNNKIWRVDIGSSKAFDQIIPNKTGRDPQILEIINNGREFNVIKFKN